MKLSQHAVEQYIARHRPDIKMPQATRELLVLCQHMVKIGPASSGGDEYECEGGLRVVVKWVSGHQLVVTTLPPYGRPVETSDAPAAWEPSRADMLSKVYAFLRGRADHGNDRGAKRLLGETHSLWEGEGVVREWDRAKKVSRG